MDPTRIHYTEQEDGSLLCEECEQWETVEYEMPEVGYDLQLKEIAGKS